jgi:hypothetical protein
MAVTVVKTPTGHKIIDQAIAGTIIDSLGDALVNFPYHALVTGDTIYLTSDIDEYNGFWYVTAIDTDNFKISEYSTAPFVEFYQEAEVDYYLTQDHEWNSIFLPIIYKATNDRWPVNTVDTARTISSASDDNGYTSMVLSGVLKATFERLEYVKIVDATDESLNGVFQIVERITTSEIVIDLPYDVDNDFTGATIQYYYNNYQVKVKVYAGLPGTHVWEPKKPAEEVAELSFTPDADGLVMFSIADYIKGKVAIKNNPLIFSYPLNLDAFTGFYISTSESFDVSDGYSLATEEDDYTADAFNGYAVAGKLAFKNTYSGDYADYIYTSGSPALWLTYNERLLAVEDKYFDISFIKNMVGTFTLTIDKYVSDYLTDTEVISYDDQGIGVYRIPIEAYAVYDSFCVRITTVASGGTTALALPALADWTTRSISGSLVDWTEGATPHVDLPGVSTVSPSNSEVIYADYAFIPGYDYQIDLDFTRTVNSGSDNPRNGLLRIYDDSFNILFSETLAASAGANVITINFTAINGATKVGFSFTSGADVDIDITAVDGTESSPTVEAAQITEEICIDLIESCEASEGFTPTDIRLTEDGDYRILE